MTRCTYFLKCSGCDLWNTPYAEQKLSKIGYLDQLLKAQNLTEIPAIEFLSCGEFALRHRTDFTIEYDTNLKQHIIGFYDLNKKLMSIENCLQFSPQLQKAYSEFIKCRFYYGNTPLKKGSVRLRVSPDGFKGCWLDFSNIEIKSLLDDQKLLMQLLEAEFGVEIGQKGKRLSQQNGHLKLVDPIPEAWFKTTNLNSANLTLNCLISDFTQPSWQTAEALVKLVLGWTLELQNIRTVLEFGSGIGQFTLAFLSHNLYVEACEINKSAVEYLQKNVKLHDLEKNLTIQLGDFHKKQNLNRHHYDLIFVNPARSGLRGFTDEILNIKPKHIIYVSCFPESMAQDLVPLVKDYKITKISIVDQFPQTKHFETCLLLMRLD